MILNVFSNACREYFILVGASNLIFFTNVGPGKLYEFYLFCYVPDLEPKL